MQIYLSKTKVIALLMMINEAEGMIGGSADGWYGLNETNPELYGDIEDAIHEIRMQLAAKGYDFEKIIKPIIGS